MEKRNLDIHKIAGQSYNDARNMQGMTKRVKILVQKVRPQAILHILCMVL